jgi:hypothetical protein
MNKLFLKTNQNEKCRNKTEGSICCWSAKERLEVRDHTFFPLLKRFKAIVESVKGESSYLSLEYLVPGCENLGLNPSSLLYTIFLELGQM